MSDAERIADLEERLDVKRKLLRIREIETLQLHDKVKELKTELARNRNKWAHEAHENARLKSKLVELATGTA
jgi:ribosomal protein L29